MRNLNTLGIISKATNQKGVNQVMLLLNQIIQTIQSGQGQLRTLFDGSVINGDIMLVNAYQGVILCQLAAARKKFSQ